MPYQSLDHIGSTVFRDIVDDGLGDFLLRHRSFARRIVDNVPELLNHLLVLLKCQQFLVLIVVNNLVQCVDGHVVIT